MNLYLLTQSYVSGYDTYDSIVVAAEDEEDAKLIHPSEYVTHVTDNQFMGTNLSGIEYSMSYTGWVEYKDIDKIKVEYLGITTKDRGVICASFNAG